MYTFFECHFCGVFEEAVTAPSHFLLSQLLLRKILACSDLEKFINDSRWGAGQHE